MINATPKCILELRQTYPELTGHYKRLADYVLESPKKIICSKAQDIAAECQCDESAVIRFCQKIGYKGFSAFKAAMAADFIPLHLNVAKKNSSETDFFSDIKHDFLDNYTKAMKDTISLFNEKEIERAVKIIESCGKVIILGAGTSGIVAMDAQIKLMRLGFNTIFHPDSLMRTMFVGLVEENDVVLAISYTGQTKEVCDAVCQAKKRNAKVISITNYPKSPLAKDSDVTLLTASDEKVFRLGAMTSRVAQCLVVDFLMLYVATSNLAKSEEYVARTHEMI